MRAKIVLLDCCDYNRVQEFANKSAASEASLESEIFQRCHIVGCSRSLPGEAALAANLITTLKLGFLMASGCSRGQRTFISLHSA